MRFDGEISVFYLAMAFPVYRKVCHLGNVFSYSHVLSRTNRYSHRYYERPTPIPAFARTLCLGETRSKEQVRKHKQEVKPAGKVKTFAVKKYMSFVDKYIDRFENRFEKKYPKAFKIYKLFKDGVRDFFRDSKMYYHVATQLWAGKTYREFSREQLENYRQIPSDMIRVAPVLIISSLPFANYVVFPIAYMFPRQLLCRHFWLPEQRVQFAVYSLQNRIHAYPSILAFMHKQSDSIKDVGKRKVFQDILETIEDEKQADVEAIIDCRDLFVKRPFGIDHLYRTHRIHMQWNIAKSLGFPGVKRKLIPATELMWNIDLAMRKEGVHNMSLEDLQQSCFSRGLNADGVNRSELIKYLQRWTTVSSKLDETNLSLLLHSPVLLSYNLPSNKKYLIKFIDITQGIIKP